MITDQRWWRAALLLACAAARLAWAAPPLTTIQDQLYNADGSQFNGVVSISWKTFQATDSSIVTAQSATVNVVNGVFRTQLVPTTTAWPAAYYLVSYSSGGKVMYVEHWNVPPSSGLLQLKDVRMTSGGSSGSGASSGGGTPLDTATISISSVTDLSNELAARPTKGVSYAPSRAAVVDATGAIGAASGNVSDCLHVDGSSGACGGLLPGFVDGETPSGSVDGTNAIFTVSQTPSPASSLAVYRNGIRLKAGLDYNVTTTTITFVSGAVPQPTDLLQVSYRTAAAADSLLKLTRPRSPAAASSFASGADVLCSGAGSAIAGRQMTTLGHCAIPVDAIRPGDRLEVRFDYDHQGRGAGFQVEIDAAGVAVLSRTALASETRLSGKVEWSEGSESKDWSSQSWGSASPLQCKAGAVTGSAKTWELRARGLGANDRVALHSFVILRYPAQ